MTLDEKIRSALRGAKKLKEVKGRWDPDSQPNVYELDNFLRKSGYRLIEVIVQENKIPELVIEPVNPGPLYPEISHDITTNTFYTDVVKYGMLEASDLAEILKGYETALGVLRHLGTVDLDSLEIPDEE